MTVVLCLLAVQPSERWLRGGAARDGCAAALHGIRCAAALQEKVALRRCMGFVALRRCLVISNTPVGVNIDCVCVGTIL